MHPFVRSIDRQFIAACVVAAAFLSAGCHRNTNNSGYGVAWITVGEVPAPVFTSYVVNVDSVTLTDALGNVYTAIATVEPVDFAKLKDIRELWGSGTIPDDTYVSATIVLDYSVAAISVLVDGAPQKANVVGPTGAAVGTVAVTVTFDPATPFVITPSYSTDNAQLLALNFDLPASNRVNFGTSPATVIVNPFFTASLAPPDTELIRVRGPLINSSVSLGTFTIYERPFYDQVNAVGSLTIFNGPSTIYTFDGAPYVGAAGLNVLSQTPAGVTMTATYATFEPTATATAFAGKFNSVYVVAGASLQSALTENLAGDVIARNGNTLTVRGATVYGQLVSLNQGYFGYQNVDSFVIVGPGTVVTADRNATLAGLNYNSIAVGQHIEALGSYSCTGTGCGIAGGLGVVTLDASVAPIGQVRLQPVQIWGQLLTQPTAPGSLSLALQTIDEWPAGVYTFAGNGSTPAGDSSPADYQVNIAGTPTPDLTAVPAGTALWIDGLTSAFGAAPPDFVASGVNQEAAVHATLQAVWTGAGATAAFAGLSNSGLSINLSDPNLAIAALQIGPESIPLSTLAVNPQIVPTVTPLSLTVAPVFSPLFAVGGAAHGIHVFSSFAAFVTDLGTAVTASAPVVQFDASGYYDRATNTFTANSISVVL